MRFTTVFITARERLFNSKQPRQPEQDVVFILNTLPNTTLTGVIARDEREGRDQESSCAETRRGLQTVNALAKLL